MINKKIQKQEEEEFKHFGELSCVQCSKVAMKREGVFGLQENCALHLSRSTLEGIPRRKKTKSQKREREIYSN